MDVSLGCGLIVMLGAYLLMGQLGWLIWSYGIALRRIKSRDGPFARVGFSYLPSRAGRWNHTRRTAAEWWTS